MTNSGILLQSKPIIGLRSSEVNDEYTNMFSDIEDDQEKLQIHAPITSFKSRAGATVFKLKPITSYSQISSHITSLCTALDKYERPGPCEEPMDFIPQKVSPKPLVDALLAFYSDRDYPKFRKVIDSIPTDNIPTSTLIQIRLLSHLYDPSIRLDTFVNNEMDPRLSCLFHWYYGTIVDKQLGCAHFLKALIDFVKTSSLCPISKFFEKFSLDNLLVNFCETLIALFYKHPLIPSVIERLASQTPNGDIIRNIPFPEDSGRDDDDSSSDDFDDLKAIQRNKVATGSNVSLIKLSDNEIANPLDILANNPDQVVVSLDDSPTMITYQLENGTSRMTPDEFEGWVLSHRYPQAKQINMTSITNIYSKPVAKETPHNLSKIEIEDILNKMYKEDVRPRIPNKSESVNQVAILPALHFINSVSSEFFGNSAPSPSMLNQEFLCHKAFETRNTNALNSTLQYFVSQIPLKLDVRDVNISMELRKLPDQEFVLTDHMKLLMCLIDISLILENRSPLTLLPSSGNMQIDTSSGSEVFARMKRIGAMYYLYSTYQYPPYIAFRAAFALGISMLEAVPNVAVRFLYEGLYILLRSYNMLGKSLWASAAFFALGEALEECGKYNYCAICLDNTLQLSLSSHLFASKAAKIAKKHEDLQRAIFYFSNAVGLFLDAQLAQEAVFTSQMLAKIYESCGQHIEGIQLLLFILKDVYMINSPRDKSNGNKAVQKKRVAAVQSSLRPDSIASIISSMILCELFLKINQFNKAEALLNDIEQYVKNPTVSKNILYLREKIAIGRNTFNGLSFIEDSGKGRAFSLISMPQSQISDPTLPLLKVLAKTYLSRNDPIMAIFWAEMICNSGKSSNTAKESAIGFYFRGLAFQLLAEQTHRFGDEFKITKELTPIELSFGSFRGERTFTKQQVISEALASYNYSMIFYDRAGNPVKYLEVQLAYVETILHMIMDANDLKRTSIKEITYSKPVLETISSDGKVVNPTVGTSFESLTLTSSNIIEHLQGQCHAIDKIAHTLMDPLSIIRSQICDGMFMQFRKKMKAAGTYFGFALSNLRKYFFNGHRFIMRDIGFYPGWQFVKTVTLLLKFLLTFPPDFINQRLILFDMYNDIHAFYLNQHRLVTFNPPIKTEASLQVQPSIVRLANPKFPDFSKIIAEYCHITEDTHKNYISKRWELLCSFSLNRKNIRNFTQHRLTEDQVYEMNKNSCLQMEKLAESIRKANPTPLANELPPHSLKSTVFIVSFSGMIVTYIPENGQKRTIRLKTGESSEFFIENLGETFSFDSSIFKKSFLEAVSNLIVSVPCITPKYKHGSSFAAECVKLGTFLFGEVPFIKELEEPESGVIKDENAFGERNPLSFSKRGTLAMLNVTKRPLIVVASSSLNFLPFEFMFPKCTLIRTVGFFKAFNRENSNKVIQRVSILKWRTEKDKLETISRIRSSELIRSMLSVLGAGEYPNIYVADFERSFPFPFALFDPMRETEKYMLLYPFCDIYPIKPGIIPELFKVDSPLFILSYADLAEWPTLIDKLVDEIPTATFLFVPAHQIPIAFREIGFIFERHAKRYAYFEKNSTDPEAQKQLKLLKNSYQMLATIQKTLTAKLKVPIGIICPCKDFYE